MAHIFSMEQWVYGRSNGRECAIWSGSRFPDLKPHFHFEAQVCTVLAGHRQFWTPPGTIEVPAGFAIYIAPHLMHRAIASRDYFSCRNYYLRVDETGLPMGCAVVFRDANGAAGISVEGLRDTLMAYRHGQAVVSGQYDDLALGLRALQAGKITTVAKKAGLGREYFSRDFRRRFGMAPSAAILARKVNFARSFLKEGVAPVAAAFEAGFADQSHMSRHFKAFFGISPGLYGRSLRRRQEVTFIQS